MRSQGRILPLPRLCLIATLLIVLRSSLIVSAVALTGGHHRCGSDEEGAFVPVRIGKNLQLRCECRNGILDRCKMLSSECQKSLVGCHFVEEDDTSPCPLVCRGCSLPDNLDIFGNNDEDDKDGMRSEKKSAKESPLMSGERRLLSKCGISECFSGVLTLSQLTCPTPMCADPATHEDECCPSCQGCHRAMQKFEEGETKSDVLDPCNECTCKKGQLTCVRKQCPVLPCKSNLWRTAPGQCCPSCVRRHEALTGLRHRCLFRGRLFNVADQIHVDDTYENDFKMCTRCVCTQSLSVVCERRICQSEASHEQNLLERQPKMMAAIVPDHCLHEGVSRAHGSSWSPAESPCVSCHCHKGQVECGECKSSDNRGSSCRKCFKRDEIKEGVCTVFGDPHYKTFDDKIFNFQGSCKYLLAKECFDEFGNEMSNGSFSIRITNDARDSLAFSWLRTVTIRLLNGPRVSLMQNMKVKVDGKRVRLPFIKIGAFSVLRDGYRIILRTNKGIKLLWDGVSFLELSVPSSFRSRMCGLCGNFNGDASDDLVASPARNRDPASHAANAWRVGGTRACSVLPRDMPKHYEPECSSSWEKRILSHRNCNALNSTLFKECRNVVDVDYYLNACRLDMCECPHQSCHCEVITAYARECERHGVLVHNWRQMTDCVNVTSFNWRSNNYRVVNEDDAEEDSDKNDTSEELKGQVDKQVLVHLLNNGDTKGKDDNQALDDRIGQFAAACTNKRICGSKSVRPSRKSRRHKKRRHRGHRRHRGQRGRRRGHRRGHRRQRHRRPRRRQWRRRPGSFRSLRTKPRATSSPKSTSSTSSPKSSALLRRDYSALVRELSARAASRTPLPLFEDRLGLQRSAYKRRRRRRN